MFILTGLVLALVLPDHFSVADNSVPTKVTASLSNIPTINDPSHFLHKRGYISATACTKHNRVSRDEHHTLVEAHSYRWLKAECSPQISRSHFLVTCNHEIITDAGEDNQEIEFQEKCPEGLECVAEHGEQNFRNEVVDDISCGPAASGDAYDTDQESTEEASPERDRPSTFCSNVMMVPLPGSTSWHRRGSRIRQSGHRRLYTLEADLKLSNGAKFIASELYILDVTSRVPWRRSDKRKVSSNSADLVVVGDTIRKIKFCVVLAAGYGYSVLFHHAVKQVRGIHQNDPRLMAEGHLQDMNDATHVPTIGDRA